MAAISFNTLGANDGVLNGMTPVTVIAAPGASVFRVARIVNVFNSDTTPVTITLQAVTGGGTRILEKATLSVGATYRFGINNEVLILDTTAKSIQLVMSAAATTTNPSFYASWGDYQ